MNKEFATLLENFLSSECEEYSMSYTWEWNEDFNCCEATIESNGKEKTVNFRHNKEDKCLMIELGEDNFYNTEEFSYTVKYFWMLIAPVLFSEN